ncbi:hypothetical protein [uncultured Methylobacterium sp.]|jgi:hypothetical protein|uniref:hypothetical protein n=1 Tax=uncultured Methylobacterium sp. TaxID=157278 RepID=UPI00260AE05F|nr:hypothetical protein [uncultured Methylobacterium sp.]
MLPKLLLGGVLVATASGAAQAQHAPPPLQPALPPSATTVHTMPSRLGYLTISTSNQGRDSAAKTFKEGSQQPDISTTD